MSAACNCGGIHRGCEGHPDYEAEQWRIAIKYVRAQLDRAHVEITGLRKQRNQHIDELVQLRAEKSNLLIKLMSAEAQLQGDTNYDDGEPCDCSWCND